MNTRMKFLVAAISLAIGGTAFGATVPQQSQPNCTTSCNQSTQAMGDATSSADNSQSEASQSNPSSNSNASAAGVTIDPSIQQSGNTVSQSGTTTANSTATGNLSTNDNHSAVGNTTASNGGNSLTQGANQSTSSAGPATTTSGSANTQGGTSNVTGGETSATTYGGQTNATASTNSGNVAGGQGGAAYAAPSTSAVRDSGNSQATGGAVGDVTNKAGVDRSGNSHQSQGQGQGQGQKQGIDRSGNSRTTTNVDTSDRSVRVDNSRVTFIPQVVPETPASAIGNGPLPVVRGACTPIMVVETTPVYSTFHGFWKRSHDKLGTTDRLVPVFDQNGNPKLIMQQMPDGSVAYWGNQATTAYTVVSTSGARSVAIGGGSSRGSWGQGGGGASGSDQQMVTHIDLSTCMYMRTTAPQIRVIYKEVPRYVKGQ